MRRQSGIFRSLQGGALLGAALMGGCDNAGEDDWRLGESRTPVADNDALLASMAASAAAGEFRIPVPLGVERKSIALGAAGKLSVGRNARVTLKGGEAFATVHSMDGVDLGQGAQVGSIYNTGPAAAVVLGQGSAVHGFVRSASEVRQAATARVDLGVIDRDAGRVEEFVWKVKFPKGELTDQTVLAEQPLLDLKPGEYGNLVIATGAAAMIHAGAYYFRSIVMQPGSFLEIDNGYGPVFLWVRDALALGGATVEYDATKPNVLIGYAGTTAPSITTPFRGTLVAPGADVELPATSLAHVGAVFARAVHLADGALFEQRAFEGADVDYAAAPDYQECAYNCQVTYIRSSNNCTSAFMQNDRNCAAAYQTCTTAVRLICGVLDPFHTWVYGRCVLQATVNRCDRTSGGCYDGSVGSYYRCQTPVDSAASRCGLVCVTRYN